MNLLDGCLSDLVTCTVTVPGDVSNCPSEAGEILLKSSIVGPEYNANGELIGINVQLVWSGETGSFIKIHRSFEECDTDSPVIATVSATQSCYYDTLQSGQIAHYYVESGRNNCPKVGESECLTISVLPQTGLNEGTVYFYVKDHLGNTRLVLDSTGAMQSRMDYEPYGIELYPLAANTSGEKYKFTNQERDYATGLDYFHARYYSSAMGRFMGADKISGDFDQPQTWNKYTYGANNPVRYFDPDGYLERDSNGNLVIKVKYKMEIGHKSDPNHWYKVRKAILRTDSGQKIEATIIQKKKPKDKTGHILDRKTRNVVADAPDSSNPMFTDCHGTTFAEGKVWINDDQVDKILKGDKYHKVESGSAKVGDVTIYRDSSGGVVHSATVTGVDDQGNVTEVTGLGGLQTESHSDPPGPGPGTAWNDPNNPAKLEIWRKEE